MSDTKLRVGIVFGGQSGEHEVSLAGAASVMAAIDRSRFEVVPIGIARDGRWLVGGDPMRALGEAAARLALAEGGADGQTKRELLTAVRGPDQPLRDDGGGADGQTKRELLARTASAESSSALARVESSESLPAGLSRSLDVVLVLLHGPRGEDGTIQGMLELAGLPYTGAGVLASAIGMDKAAMKDMFRAHGLPIVEHVLVKRHEWEHDPAGVASQVAARIGVPCFVKPANLGSSVGVSKVKAEDDLAAAIDLAARHDRRILVERAVQGREVEVAVLGNDAPIASVPGEVCYAGEWYDYETKYGEGHTTFKVPAALSPETTELVRAIAVKAFSAIDGAGMARVDFFIEPDGRVLLNEINTIPGFTATSAYPRLWAASGIPYPELISRLIELALERR